MRLWAGYLVVLGETKNPYEDYPAGVCVGKPLQRLLDALGVMTVSLR